MRNAARKSLTAPGGPPAPRRGRGTGVGVLPALEGVAHAVEPLGEGGAGTGEVEPDEAGAAAPERLAVGQRDSRLVEEERVRVAVRQVGLAAIEPGQIGRLRRGRADAGQLRP